MKIRDAIAQAAANNEKAFKGIAEERAIKIVNLVMKELASEINKLDEGKVAMPSFGTFVIRQVERELDGVKATQKRIVFRPKAE